MARRKRRPPPAAGGPAPDASPLRVPAVDALRGLAILAMIAYHFAFDLRFFGLSRADFENDPFWLGARAAIVTSFLLLVGISLVLAHRARVAWPAFARRVAIVAACALAASAASYALFPATYITFGILHFIALASLLARPLAARPRLALALGAGALAGGLAFSHPFFDARATSWIGFTTRKPATQDYVPLFPWIGVVLAGIALGAALARRSFAPVAGLDRLPAALRWLGRHSLLVYMVHQPLLMGALWAVVALAR
ncbi:MAG: hypothetical protein BroJett026_32750 [Betaproteobacteria bacterium]|nr:MAG: hypothetical protein BroJett026_32750 [Betaproteobacteria bacterium]